LRLIFPSNSAVFIDRSAKIFLAAKCRGVLVTPLIQNIAPTTSLFRDSRINRNKTNNQ